MCRAILDVLSTHCAWQGHCRLKITPISSIDFWAPTIPNSPTGKIGQPAHQRGPQIRSLEQCYFSKVLLGRDQSGFWCMLHRFALPAGWRDLCSIQVRALWGRQFGKVQDKGVVEAVVWSGKGRHSPVPFDDIYTFNAITTIWNDITAQVQQGGGSQLPIQRSKLHCHS